MHFILHMVLKCGSFFKGFIRRYHHMLRVDATKFSLMSIVTSMLPWRNVATSLAIDLFWSDIRWCNNRFVVAISSPCVKWVLVDPPLRWNSDSTYWPEFVCHVFTSHNVYMRRKLLFGGLSPHLSTASHCLVSVSCSLNQIIPFVVRFL